MAYGMPMTPEERMMRLIMQRRNNPYGTPMTMESQVAAGTAQLDPRALEAAGGMAIPASPDLSQNSMSAKQAALQAQARSTAGMESRLASQQAFADSLRGTPSAKLQRVGPSNIAVANPWDGLEVGFNRALGGYMSGKLRDDYTAVDEAKTDQAMGQAEYEAMLAQEERDFTANESEMDRGLRQAIADAGNDVTIRGQDLTASSAAANRAAQGVRDVATESYFNPNAGEPGEPPVLTYRMIDGALRDNEGNPVDVTGMTPYNAVSPQSLTAAEARPTAAQVKAADEAGGRLADMTSRFPNMARLAEYSTDEARQFTGFNPDSGLANLGWGPDGVEGQQFKSLVGAEEVGGLLPAIAAAKLTPVSDKDIAIVRQKFVDSLDQPETIAQFYGYTGRQLMQQTIAENLKNDQISAQEARDIQLDYDKMAANLAIGWGYDPKKLITAGMDPKLVAYIAEKIRRGL